MGILAGFLQEFVRFAFRMFFDWLHGRVVIQ